VCDRSGPAKLHIAQDEREPDGSKREHRERPEGVDIARSVACDCTCWPIQAEGLLLCLYERASVSRSVRPSMMGRNENLQATSSPTGATYFGAVLGAAISCAQSSRGVGYRTFERTMRDGCSCRHCS
jgi:hypothetical protein